MPETWHPTKLRTQLRVEVAYNRDQIWFRFRWSQPDPGGWLHDMLVYRDGRWHRPALHHGAGQRWHWVAYPYKLGLGVEPNDTGAAHTDGTTELVAEAFSGERPDWDDHETYTIPLLFPGVLEWSDLTNDEHPQVDRIRTAEITMWELYENGSELFLD